MRRLALVLWAGLVVPAVPAAVPAQPQAPALSAAQIVERNVAARGGVESWRKIRTMVWVGHMENAGGPAGNLPFVLEQKRPNKTRFELNAMGERSLRVFDGERGWKVRAGRDGAPDVQPFSPQELKFSQAAIVIDSPLIDHEAKGVTVALDGVEQVDGRPAYRLTMRLAGGERHDVWVDAETFLDVKYDRTSYSPTGVPVRVVMYYKDYKLVDGLQIPGSIETDAGPGRPPARMVIEKIALNPNLEDRMFARPGVPTHRKTVTIGPDAPPGVPQRPAATPATGRGAAAPAQ